ncbi:hypothetical protein QJQ45_002403 [Haematococcus lacustris]|nr:hypothetical protein QJQ45_002403 [Haematococcus lacustris]
MVDVITACKNLKPSQVPLAHRTCAEAAAAAHAVCQRLRGQEPASQLQPMPRLSSTPTQAPAQPGPAHATCPHHLPDQPPLHPSQSQLQGSSQHHPALPALMHLPGLSILTRPATNPVTSPAVEQQPIIHTTEEQDEQTMPPSMPKQQQDWATARSIAAEVLQQIQQIPALLRLLRSQPDSKVTLQLSTLQDAEVQLGRLEFALQHIISKLTVERSVEIMSEHWHAQQIGILVACAYFKNKEGVYKEHTVYVMTDGKEQSAAITQAAVNQVVCYLLAEHDMDMRQLYMWSDGCAGQFKGAPAMRQHWGMAQRFSMPVWWSYGATAHFKGRHDSEGGVVKQWLRGEILADRVGKCNALGFVQHCNAYHKPAAAADPSKAHRARASVGHRWCLELSTREVELCSAPQRDAHVFASSIPGSMSMHSCFFPAAGIQVEWSETACACAQCMTPAPRGVCMRPSITKPFVAMPMFDQKRDDKHWDDECLTLLCSFAPDSVKQLCTLGKKLSVKMLNEYCKAVGLYVPANTLRADLRYMHMLVCVKLSTSGVAEVYLEPPPVTPEPHCLDTLLPYFDSPEVEPCITVHNKRFPASHALQQGPWQLYHVEVCGDWAPHESHCSFPNCLYLHPPQQTATLASSQQVGQGPVLSHGPQWAVSAAAGAGAAVNNIQPLPQPLQMLQPMQRHGNASVGQAGPQAHWQPQPAALHSMALQVKQQQEGRQQGGQLHGLPGVRTRCNSRGLCDLVVWLAEPTVQGVRHHLANMIGKLQYEGKPWSPESLYLVLRSTYGADELVQLGVTRAEVVRLSTEPGLLELLRQTQQTRHPMLEAWLHYQTEADADLTADIVQRPRSR